MPIRHVPTFPATKALAQFHLLLADVDYVMSRHPNADGRSGQPFGSSAGPISRAAVLLTYAAWEVYIEESLLEVAEWIASRPVERLPAATRAFIDLKAKADPWVLEGGWQAGLVELVRRETTGSEEDGEWGMNNADPAHVIALQRLVLGAAPLKDAHWQNRSNDQLLAKLEKFVRLRGEIAHSGRTSSRLWAGDFKKDWRVFIPNLVEEVDYRIRMWMTIQNDPESDWWRAIEGLLLDGHWHFGTGIQDALGVTSPQRAGDRATYESLLGLLQRRVAEGILVKGGHAARPQYRLAGVPNSEVQLEIDDEAKG